VPFALVQPRPSDSEGTKRGTRGSKTWYFAEEERSLTDAKVRTAKGRNKAYKLTDSNRLFLLVTPSGGTLCRWSYTYDGKQKSKPFGAVNRPTACARSPSPRHMVEKPVELREPGRIERRPSLRRHQPRDRGGLHHRRTVRHTAGGDPQPQRCDARFDGHRLLDRKRGRSTPPCRDQVLG
jgi:hypothetical protein